MMPAGNEEDNSERRKRSGEQRKKSRILWKTEEAKELVDDELIPLSTEQDSSESNAKKTSKPDDFEDSSLS